MRKRFKKRQEKAFTKKGRKTQSEKGKDELKQTNGGEKKRRKVTAQNHALEKLMLKCLKMLQIST